MNSANLPQFTRQDGNPLYPKILYNRPVTRSGAGRLLVVGGHPEQFSLPTAIHQLSLAAGVGECRVALPDVLAKLLGGAPGTAFVASSPSGSLGREALGRILQLSEDTDAVAIGASLSNNSATAILVEKLAAELERPLVIIDDALAALQHHIRLVTDNPQTLVILTMAEVFKLCGWLGVPIHIREHGGLINKLEIIRDLQAAGRASYAVYGPEIITATGATAASSPTAGTELVVTPINYRLSLVPAIFYAVLSTFWLQNRANPAAGLATGAYIIREASAHLGATDRPSVPDLAAALDRARRIDEW